MQVRMRAVDVVGPRRSRDPLLRELHRAGVVHLVPFEAPPGVGPAVFGPPGPEPAAARTAEWHGLATELVSLLGASGPDPAALAELWAAAPTELEAAVASARELRERASALAADRSRLAAERERIAFYRRIVDSLRPVASHLPSLAGYGTTAIVVDARYRALVPLIREELEGLTDGRCEVVTADLPPDRVVAILVYPARQLREVRSLLGGRDIEEVTLPQALSGVPFGQLAERLDAEGRRIETSIDEAAGRLAELRSSEGPRAEALRLVLGDRVAETEALRGAAQSDHLVILSGWVPEDRVEALRAALTDALGPVAAVVERPESRMQEAPEVQEAPVALINRRLARAFEPLASLVAVPRYGTIDPTPLLALAFPAFVGLMVGDAGYGVVALVLLAIARLRWRTSPLMAVVWPIGFLATVSTIAFGILFGEWFGDVGHRAFGIEPLWIDRAEATIPLLVLALSIGAVHVTLGLVLGVANAVLLRHRREAVGRVALLVGLAAMLLAVVSVADVVPAGLAGPAVAVVLGALVVSFVAIGIAGPVEMIGAVSNVLSYARLMAIGLASVMLALVANRLGGLFENVLVGAVVAMLIHGLNIALGFFDSSIQGLRLNYVEFFGRFVEPGGTRYAPFVSVLGPRVGPGAPVGRS